MRNMESLLDLVESESIDFDAVLRLFEHLSSDMAQCEAYAHPYGFSVFNLFDDGSGGVLRLHVWSNDRRAIAESEFDIHDHVYSLSSVIICGSISQTTYSIGKGEPNSTYYIGSYGENSSTISPTNDTVHVVATSVQTFLAGHRYQLPSGQLHSVVPSQDTSATLVATRRSIERLAPMILGPIGRKEARTFERERLSLERKTMLLDEALRCTHAKHPRKGPVPP